MSEEFFWPSTARIGDGRSHENTGRDFEAMSIREQWETQRERLFCQDEDDMLVQCGIVSGKGAFQDCSDEKEGSLTEMN
jgi:hypothetical protein